MRSTVLSYAQMAVAAKVHTWKKLICRAGEFKVVTEEKYQQLDQTPLMIEFRTDLSAGIITGTEVDSKGDRYVMIATPYYEYARWGSWGDDWCVAFQFECETVPDRPTELRRVRLSLIRSVDKLNATQFDPMTMQLS